MRHSGGKTTTQNPATQNAGAYDRKQQLPCLLAIHPAELAGNVTATAVSRLVSRLRRALRAERARGRAGHATYDLNRHMALVTAIRAETALLAQLTGKPIGARPGGGLAAETRGRKARS